MGKVAPHRNCEVRLVLSGTKPLAAIEKSKDPYGYSIAVALSKVGMLSSMQIQDHTLQSSGEIIITKPQNKHLLMEYFDTLTQGVGKYGIKGYHRKMGKLFGYTDSDIEAFIDANIQCDCAKCTGAKLH